MEREIINDIVTEDVVGGSIIFNADHTTCGRKNNHEYKVIDYDAVDTYIKANCTKMCEKDMINNMLASGLLANM